MTHNKVLNRPVPAITDCCCNGLLGVLLVALDHLGQKIPLILGAGCHTGGCDHFILGVNSPLTDHFHDVWMLSLSQ